MHLRPSDIYYTQDSISPYFDRQSSHSWRKIGETLDDLCENRCSIYHIPTISVTQRNGKWFTADNRRLWVFRHLERLGKCSTVPVYTTHYINPAKFTTFNGGESVFVRGSPGGRWYLSQPSVDIGDSISFPLRDNGNNIPAVSRIRNEGLASCYLYSDNRTYSSVPETSDDHKIYFCLFVSIIILVITALFILFWNR